MSLADILHYLHSFKHSDKFYVYKFSSPTRKSINRDIKLELLLCVLNSLTYTSIFISQRWRK